MILLCLIWSISFLVTFIVSQWADRNAGINSFVSTMLNLVICSVPLINIFWAVVCITEANTI